MGKSFYRSEIAENVVHIGIEKHENKIYINVGPTALEQTEAFLKETYPKLYHCNIFCVLDGASASFSTGFSALPNKTDFDKNRCKGDAFKHIKSGISIEYPDITKVKRISKDAWDYDDNTNRKDVSWLQGTLGAICIDRNTGALHGLTAGHVYAKESGYHQGAAHTNCFLLQDGVPKREYISDTFISYVGSAKKKHGVDVAAIPLFPHIRNKCHMNPYFHKPDDHLQVKSATDIKLSVYRGPSEDLVEKPVQKRGAITGYRKGTIIKSEDVFVPIQLGNKMTVIGYDCFIIGSDEEEDFAETGDSGSLIVSDLSGSEERYAHGIFFYILNDCKQYISKVTGKPFSKVFVCVRLDKSLETLNESSGLSLDLYTPNNTVKSTSLLPCSTKGLSPDPVGDP